MSLSKKKTPAHVKRNKGIDLLSKAALLEEAQMKKDIKKSKQETHLHQEGGSSDGAGVPDVSKSDSSDSEYESWGVTDDDDNDQQGDDERTESDDDKNVYLNKTNDEEETQEDEFVHTLDDYVLDDKTDDVDDEEYDRISKEMYADNENVNQEVAGDQVKDDAQETVTAAPATQKTEVPLPSSSISSDFAAKFLNFDNIPSADTEINSMLEIKVQHEYPSIQTSPLLTVPVSIIPESSIALATTIPPPILLFIPLPQQSTPIPTPTTIEATILTTTVLDSSTLTAIHQRVSDLEKEVKILKDINHDSAILVAIKSEVPSTVKECLGTNLDDTLEKVIKKQLAEFIQEHSVPAAAVADVINKQLDS
ncbi:hypothetical protein Tco_0418220 [Tanacetum coccineum]